MMRQFLNSEELLANKGRKNFQPKVNISEWEKNFELALAVPGYQKEDLKINVEENVLTISASIEHNEKESTKEYSRQEFSTSSFSRSFYLPEDVESEKIEAKFENGVLHLALPKIEAVVLKKEIEIK